jgi:hypothetical protein
MVRDEVLGRSDCTALIDPALWAKSTSHDYLSFWWTRSVWAIYCFAPRHTIFLRAVTVLNAIDHNYLCLSINLWAC